MSGIRDVRKLRDAMQHQTRGAPRGLAQAADRQRQPVPQPENQAVPDVRPGEARERLERDESTLFRQAVAGAKPLAPSDRADLSMPAPPAIPRQHLLDEQAALAESLSDAVDVDSLLETDATLSYRRPGIGADVVRKLRRGHWVIQDELDLHGLRSDEARESLSAFIHQAQAAGRRCVRVIHGKGLSSPGREPVLKHKTRAWLVQKNEVLAFCQAKPADGGAGALVVLLRAAPGLGTRQR
jgi:DNA-nicking Smr family endonuclease